MSSCFPLQRNAEQNYLALTASQLFSFLYMESKPARKDPKDRHFRCLFPSMFLLHTFSCPLHVMTCLCQQGRLPSCVAAAPVFNNNQLMIFNGYLVVYITSTAQAGVIKVSADLLQKQLHDKMNVATCACA